MRYEFDSDVKKPSPWRVFWIFAAVALVTAGGIFLLVGNPRGEESGRLVSSPGETSGGKSVPVPGPVPAEKLETAVTPLPSGKADASEDAAASSVEVDTEKTAPGKTPDAAESSGGPAVPTVPAAVTDEPEKGKPWAGDDPEDPPRRPAGLSGEAAEDFRTRVNEAEEKDDVEGLRKLVGETVENSEDYLYAGSALGRLSMKHYAAGDGASSCRVAPGDNLSRIARRLKVTVDSLIYLNRLRRADLIRAGQTLKYMPGTFSVRISKESRLLKLLHDGKLFKVYEIGVGRQGRTPLGRFTVGEKLKTPVWYPGDGREVRPGDADNQLGTRYIALNNHENRPTGYGIHGSRDEETVGKSLSHGCIRMKNSDAEELYMFLPIGAEILIEK